MYYIYIAVEDCDVIVLILCDIYVTDCAVASCESSSDNSMLHNECL